MGVAELGEIPTRWAEEQRLRQVSTTKIGVVMLPLCQKQRVWECSSGHPAPTKKSRYGGRRGARTQPVQGQPTLHSVYVAVALRLPDRAPQIRWRRAPASLSPLQAMMVYSDYCRS